LHARGGDFHRDVTLRVSEYFRRASLSPRADAVMRWRTAALAAWFLASYLGLVFVSKSLASAIPLAASLSLAVAGIGFGIAHDANHGAYSRRRWVNRLLRATLDVIGASSYVWRWRHNVVHHCHPSVVGVDADIDLQPYARLMPQQPSHPLHRFQCFYLWIFYGVSYLNWHAVEDFRNVLAGRIGSRSFPRPRGPALALFVGGKIVFFAWALVVPALLHPLGIVAPFYLGCSIMVGAVSTCVIQLTHCTEPALSSLDRVASGSATRQSRHEWAVRQVVTASDFARANRLVGWYLGGLNFQIEHHLFPTVCHVHYPALSSIVERACKDHGIPYAAHATVWAALSSHFRFLVLMGRGTATQAVRRAPITEAV
jgi:linoleoyl-CoA desaturase